MLNEETAARERVLFQITTLMLIFLPLSTAANYLNHRPSFSILYLFMFIATLAHRYCYHKERDLDQAAEQVMIILFGLFFTFFVIGEQRTFDIFWILILPVVAVMLESLQRLKVWLIRFMVLVLVMLGLSYVLPQFIRYDTFALWSLLWASVFVSGLAWQYKQTQERLEQTIHSYQQHLEQKVEEAVGEIMDLNKELDGTQIEILERLGTLGEYRSKETGAHVRRVGLYSRKLAELAGLDHETALLLERAAPLHDIGKVGIPDAILNKPGKLTEEEYETMKAHPAIGESILAGSDKPLIRTAAEIAGGHHEKYDGSGYPRGLEGEAIPVAARITAIADVFDALYSHRVYKAGWDIDAIRNHFKAEAGRHFDPALTALFLNNLPSFTQIYEANAD
jgi:hypothetical protein